MRPDILLVTTCLFLLFGTSQGAKSKKTGPGKHNDEKGFSESKYIAENLDKACKITDDEGTSLNATVITCSDCSLCDIGPYSYYDKATKTVIEASFCSKMIHDSLGDYACRVNETSLERECGTRCDLDNQLQYLIDGSEFTYAFCKNGVGQKKCNFDKIGLQDLFGLESKQAPCKAKEVFEKLLSEACYILNEDTGEQHFGSCCPDRCTKGPAALTYYGDPYILMFCDESEPEPQPIVSSLNTFRRIPNRKKQEKQEERLPAVSNMQVLQPMKLSRPLNKKKRKKKKPKKKRKRDDSSDSESD